MNQAVPGVFGTPPRSARSRTVYHSGAERSRTVYHGSVSRGTVEDAMNACASVGPKEEVSACGVRCSPDAEGGAQMSYVGGGNGEYIEETIYRYVGTGGDYTEEPRRSCAVCWTALGCCLVLMLIPLMCWLLRPAGDSVQQPNIDCAYGVDAWSTLWTAEKKEYCCSFVGLGCTTAAASLNLSAVAVASTPSPSVLQWPRAQGTAPSALTDAPTSTARTLPPTVSPGPLPRTATTGAPATARSAVAIEAVTTSTVASGSVFFNCDIGYSNFKKLWSSAKKEWCCHELGRACVVEKDNAGTIMTTSAPFDCKAGLDGWKVEWSMLKRAWCCRREKVGCPQE